VLQHPSGFSSEKTLTERAVFDKFSLSVAMSSDGNRVIIGAR
jgi:hypothetical protein